jgi:hypothetical protein
MKILLKIKGLIVPVLEEIIPFIRTKKIEWERAEREKVCLEWAKELKEYLLK